MNGQKLFEFMICTLVV